MKRPNRQDKKEFPSSLADRIGKAISLESSKNKKKHFGQYFTPTQIGIFMAGLFSLPKKDRVDILDPGAGLGLLACTLCERLSTSQKLQEIRLTTYEIDENLIPKLKKVLNYLEDWLSSKDIGLKTTIRNEDYVLANAGILNSRKTTFPQNTSEEFDYVISNPPYFKIPLNDKRAIKARNIIHGQPNIYALFMGIAASQLKQTGEMVFITPRSFTSGYYFRLFRNYLFSQVEPKLVHIFASRKDAFQKDNVLQENIITHFIKPLWENSYKSQIKISHSRGTSDLSNSIIKKFPTNHLLDLDSNNKVLITPVSEKQETAIIKVREWNESFHSNRLSVSTGPVVAFRAKRFITNKKLSNTIPLLWLQNVRSMSVKWLVQKRGQYIRSTKGSEKLLVANRNYVILRRFSAKGEKKRLVAAPHLKKKLKVKYLGIENHLNYIYGIDRELTVDEVFGLAALLNSEIMDEYFRSLSGNTQVSATEIKDMPLPDIDTIKKIGKKIKSGKITEKVINGVVNNLL